MKIKMKLALINPLHLPAAVWSAVLCPSLLAVLPVYITFAALLVLRQALLGDLDEGLTQFKNAAETYTSAWGGVTDLVKECLQ